MNSDDVVHKLFKTPPNLACHPYLGFWFFFFTNPRVLANSENAIGALDRKEMLCPRLGTNLALCYQMALRGLLSLSAREDSSLAQWSL